MRTIVCMKAVHPWTGVLPTLGSDGLVDGGPPDTANEWDEFALEEALLIAGSEADSVTVVTVGPHSADRILKRALALGAGRAIRIWDPAMAGGGGEIIARILSDVLRRHEFDLILTGAQAEDDGAGHVGPMLAQMLGLPYATLVKQLDLRADGRVVVHRELEDGLEEVSELDLPALVTIQTGINEPRLPNTKGILKAAKASIELLGASDLGGDWDHRGTAGSRAVVTALEYAGGDQAKADILGGGAEDGASLLAELLHERGVI